MHIPNELLHDVFMFLDCMSLYLCNIVSFPWHIYTNKNKNILPVMVYLSLQFKNKIRPINNIFITNHCYNTNNYNSIQLQTTILTND